MEAVLPGRVLKPVYCVVAIPVSALGEIGYFDMDIHELPPSWQALQPVVTPAWIWAVEGTGDANSVPGGETVALAGTT